MAHEGHLGIVKLKQRCRDLVWWPGIDRDIEGLVRDCEPYLLSGKSGQPVPTPLQPVPWPSRPWEHLQLDILVDRFSKAVHFVPLPKLPSARETAQLMVDHVFRLHGLPVDVVSDRGPQFSSRFWKEFCRQIGASASLSSGFHPQTNGQCERANQDLGRMLRCLTSSNPSSWCSQLSWVEYAHNSLQSSASGMSPFECSLGYNPPLFPSQEPDAAVPSALAFVQRCRRTWRKARGVLARTMRRTKAVADRHRSSPPVYVCGQRVWLSTKDLPLRAPSRKLAPKFIRNFSSVAEPLTTLTKKSNGPFTWTDRANQAFDSLKQHFTSAPILVLPDPELPFVLEVDASDVGVGAVLSQRSKNTHKLHPCAFFSRRLSPTQRNYDIGNRELLATHPETILPTSRVLASIQWDLEEAVKRAQKRQPDPGNGPRGRLFVPDHLRSKVLQWAHASPSSGHPGATRTCELLQRKFWWPRIQADVRTFVSACWVCAQNKEPRSHPQGLLHPLPIPRRPWSHISLDFTCRLIPLPKLPTAIQTAEIMMRHVFRIHGFPQDMVSDRGPQFTSRFWKAFGQLIGSSVSLSSGFHPQSNGQTERVNQDIEKTLRCLVSNNQTTWTPRLMWAEFAHNTLYHSSLHMSPFECLFGFPPSLFPGQEPEAEDPAATQFVRRCQHSWQRARAALIKATQLQQRQANKRRRVGPILRVGQRVWLSTRDLP
ncbi:hypothetical protein IRJ41_000814, partial [Triplophysa rosa]